MSREISCQHHLAAVLVKEDVLLPGLQHQLLVILLLQLQLLRLILNLQLLMFYQHLRLLERLL